MSGILVVSIFLRLAAAGWSVLLVRRLDDWRLGFLTALLVLAACRQVLELSAAGPPQTASALVGLAVSLMALPALFFLERVFTERHQAAAHERRRIEERQQEVVRELEEKNAALRRFTYTVSHDLKSPLLTIRGFLGLLEKDSAAGDAERMRQDIERIDIAAGMMQQLLGELLELSRIGRMVNPSEEVALEELAREAVERVAGRITEGGVEVVVLPDLPAVVGDRVRLQQMLQNLVDNAAKYMGDQDAPRLEVGARREAGEVVGWVRDNGIGIDRRFHTKVFGLFQRLDRELEGTGIGLALVARIVEVHGGRVWVESEGEGCGSTFFFALPADGS